MPRKMVAMRMDPDLLARFDRGAKSRGKSRVSVIETLMERQAHAWEQNDKIGERVAARRDPAR